MSKVINKSVLLIHGGATNLKFVNNKNRIEYVNHLKGIIRKAGTRLINGEFSIDVVVQAVKDLENCELFNAGRGAVLNEIGKVSLEASLMEGKLKYFGSILNASNIRNPILLCENILTTQNRLILSNKGVEKYAKENNFDLVDNSYFITPLRKEYWSNKKLEEQCFGTVGAVALDIHGNLCSGTSSGGISNKILGRIGDSGLIGSGTFADNKTCAISCTGDGEYFIQNNVSYRISSLIELKNLSIKNAIKKVIKEVKNTGGQGGIIGVDKLGNYWCEFTTKGMYRGIFSKEIIKIEIE